MVFASSHIRFLIVSPSTRRVWIEIALGAGVLFGDPQSPSTRRVWIEILTLKCPYEPRSGVTLHAEGVD